MPPTPAELPALDTTCDSVDDDCDGTADDDYVPDTTYCGVGACATTGLRQCVDGTFNDTCAPLFAAAYDTICDGIDDNCNGSIDEQYTPQCTANAVATCSSGTPVLIACDDGNACTADGCSSGACTHTVVSCDDGNDCTGDSCDPFLGCASVANIGSSCNDADLCTIGELCTASGSCLGATVDTDDHDVCTDDSCDPQAGVEHRVVVGRACGDGDVCNGLETCDLQLGCVGGTGPAVDDGNACTVDACDAVSGVSHAPAALGLGCGENRYCDGAGVCQLYALCASNLVLAAGQNLTFSGPCAIDAITFNGGSLTINGALKTGAVSMTQGGTLTTNAAGALIASSVFVSNGSISAAGDIVGSITQAGGSIKLGGAYSVPQSGTLSITAGTFINQGSVSLPAFDTSVSGGTFINRGQLNVISNVVNINAGVTLSENGTLNATDTIKTLNVNGTLTHEAGQLNGLVLNVTEDATINGSIALSGMGLRGTNTNGSSAPAQMYKLVNGEWTVVNIPAGVVGASHGGLGGAAGATYDSVTQPSMLGSGADGNPGGSGGGRVKLTVGGKITVNGSIVADAINGANGAGGAGGAIWLIARELVGAGPISANGGNGPYSPNVGGGGRIALEYALKSHAGREQASAGIAGNQSAGAGTIYERDVSGGTDKLVISNVDAAGVATASGLETVLPVGTPIPSALEMLGGVLRLTSSLTPASLKIANGQLSVNGDLATDSLQMLPGLGKLTIDGSLTVATRPTLQGGNVIVKGALLSPVTIAGGKLTVAGTYSVTDVADFTLNSGSCEVTGVMNLPEFSPTNVAGGRFINSGQLNVTSNVLDIKAGATLSENGFVNATDTVRTLNVNGTLTHEAGQVNGLSLNVIEDVTINGSIALSGAGLRGDGSAGSSAPAQMYQLVNGAWTVVNLPPGVVGASHGGLGGAAGPTYDSVTQPAMLGSGAAGNPGGSGGGRVKLTAGGRIAVNGSVLADGIAGTNGAGAAGGAIWLIAHELAGAGPISANGGNGPYYPNIGGGGRIALEYALKSHSGREQASGGIAGTDSAGAGTLYEWDSTNATNKLVIGNVNGAGVATAGGLETLLPANTLAFDRIDLTGGAFRIDGNVMTGATGQVNVSVGTLNVSGNLSVSTLRLLSGTMKVTGTVHASSLVDVAGGVLSVPGNITANSLRLTSGSIEVSGSAQAALMQSGGVFTNTGVTSLPNFAAGSISVGVWNNRGRLNIASNALEVAPGVTLNESGSLGANDSIGTLSVQGVLTHDARSAAGVSLSVTGDAALASGASIIATGLGLRGGANGGNTSVSGETYGADSATVVSGAVGRVGGSYGGLGGNHAGTVGPVYGLANGPVLLGSGGGASSTSFVGGNGGGRIDLIVNGTLTVDGTIASDGQSGNSTAETGGGSGGAVRLRVGVLRGSGAIRANGGGGHAGGAGGRISIDYETTTFGGSLSAAGGGGAFVDGAFGTVNSTSLTGGTAVADVRSALRTSCLLDAHGGLACWGDDTQGLASQRPAGIYSGFDMGPDTACAVHASGLPQCWGQPGTGLLIEPLVPLAQVGVGFDTVCGLRTSVGTLLCWGSDGFSLVSGAPTGAFTQLAMSANAACALGTSGLLHCWGDDSHGEVSSAPTSAVLAFDGGYDHFCAVLADTSLRCWGDNAHAKANPPSGNYVDVSAGSEHACAIDAAGAVTCWGDNTYGQATPPSEQLKSIAAGDRHTCGLTQAGTLLCWGDNTYGAASAP